MAGGCRLSNSPLPGYRFGMFRLEHASSFEQIIRKSRFLATAIPVASEEEAKTSIIAASEADANHNCWAWRIGQNYRFSDGGEPSGTAGRPILAAIDGHSVDHVAVVVSRWFGGTLLGAGGLVRAYGGSAASCLKSAALARIIPSLDATIRLGFSELALVRSRLASVPDIRILDERFTAEGAEIGVRIPLQSLEAISKLIADLTSGKSRLVVRNPASSVK